MKEIELEEMNIIIKVPKDALKVTIKVQVPGYDGEIIKAKKKFLKTDIDKARKDFLDNVEEGDDFNTEYVLTKKGMEYLKQLREKQGDDNYFGNIAAKEEREITAPTACYDIPSDELHKELTRLGYWLANKDRRELIALQLGFRSGGDLACHLYHLDNG